MEEKEKSIEEQKEQIIDELKKDHPIDEMLKFSEIDLMKKLEQISAQTVEESSVNQNL